MIYSGFRVSHQMVSGGCQPSETSVRKTIEKPWDATRILIGWLDVQDKETAVRSGGKGMTLARTDHNGKSMVDMPRAARNLELYLTPARQHDLEERMSMGLDGGAVALAIDRDSCVRIHVKASNRGVANA